MAERRTRRPADTPDGRETQLISDAYDLVEKRLRNETASAQETVFFLKLGSSRERLEQEKIRNENLKTQAQIAELSSRTYLEQLTADALVAMRSYKGLGEEDAGDDGEYDD